MKLINYFFYLVYSKILIYFIAILSCCIGLIALSAARTKMKNSLKIYNEIISNGTSTFGFVQAIENDKRSIKVYNKEPQIISYYFFDNDKKTSDEFRTFDKINFVVKDSILIKVFNGRSVPLGIQPLNVNLSLPLGLVSVLLIFFILLFIKPMVFFLKILFLNKNNSTKVFGIVSSIAVTKSLFFSALYVTYYYKMNNDQFYGFARISDKRRYKQGDEIALIVHLSKPKIHFAEEQF